MMVSWNEVSAESKLETIANNIGSLYFCVDTGNMFLDSQTNGRIAIAKDIVYLDTESDRETLLVPIPNKIYCVKDSNKLYYYDGEWNNIGGSSVELDKTLSIEGMAADAKAVGDELAKKISTEVGWGTDTLQNITDMNDHQLKHGAYWVNRANDSQLGTAVQGVLINTANLSQGYGGQILIKYDGTPVTTLYIRSIGFGAFSPWQKVGTDIDSTLSDSSTNPVENKVVNAAIEGRMKLDGIGSVPYLSQDGKDITDDFMTLIPSGLPKVTASDNDKFLRVVDGAWTAVALPNAEEASF